MKENVRVESCNEERFCFTFPNGVPREISKLIRSLGKDYFDKRSCEDLEERIGLVRSTIMEEREFIENSLIDGTNSLFTQFSEMMFIDSVILDPVFISIVVRNSLTNRLVDACTKREMPASLKRRIKTCMIATMLYYC